MEIELNYSNGEFTYPEKPKGVINDEVLNVVITCNPPFKGQPKELAELAVEFFNEQNQMDWHFNTILISKKEFNATCTVGFQMCREVI